MPLVCLGDHGREGMSMHNELAKFWGKYDDRGLGQLFGGPHLSRAWVIWVERSGQSP